MNNIEEFELFRELSVGHHIQRQKELHDMLDDMDDMATGEIFTIISERIEIAHKINEFDALYIKGKYGMVL
jgi:poly(A) polymerase Pap1